MQPGPFRSATGVCVLCRRSPEASAEVVITTAIQDVSSRKSGFKQYDVTTTMSRIERESMRVCSDCVSRSRRRQVAVVVLAVVAGVVGIPLMIGTGLPGQVVGFVACLVLVGGVIGGLYLSLPMTVKNHAIRARRRTLGLPDKYQGRGPIVVGFTEAEYRRLAARQKR